MVREVRGRGVSVTTARYAAAVLGIALGRARKERRVVHNVVELVDLPKPEQREFTPPSGEQARALIDAVTGHRFGPLFTVAIATGMRQGELLGLRWQNVDLEAGYLHIKHTLQQGTRILADTKTERSRRTLALSAPTAAALREQRRRQLEARLSAGRRWREDDYVFTTALGTPLDSPNVTRALHTVLRQSGLPRQRFHDLRHAYATLMLEDGEDLALVSRSLGHSKLSTTADTYGHVTPAMQARIAARMDRILARESAWCGYACGYSPESKGPRSDPRA
jgi:integrase